MSGKISIEKLPLVIFPSKYIIEDFEILAFEHEDELNYYSVWHETLFDKRRELNAESERERQIILTETIRKTSSFLIGTHETSHRTKKSKPLPNLDSSPKISKPKPIQKQPTPPKSSSIQIQTPASPTAGPSGKSPSKQLAASRALAAALAARSNAQTASTQPPPNRNRFPPPGSAVTPDGFAILNSSYYNTLPSGKQMMKYKLTKLYNKYRGRQTRRNYVFDKQRNAKIEAEVSKSYLNSWLAYTALQALRLPDNNLNQLSTVTSNNTKFLTTLPAQSQISQAISTTQLPPSSTGGSTPKKSAKKQQITSIPTSTPNSSMPPMHIVYIDPGNIITYSNKINPQQVAEYRQKSHLLPSSATSKKSSAASYDAYEIMEVLANTNKTNVTITRNANRPAQPGCSVYSHSVNANTPGIVSTQLHLQARSYLDSLSKFYAEEYQRLENEREEMRREPTSEEIIAKYLKI